MQALVSASLADGFGPLIMIRQWRKSESDFLTVFVTLCEVPCPNEQLLYDEICPKLRCANRKLNSNRTTRKRLNNYSRDSRLGFRRLISLNQFKSLHSAIIQLGFAAQKLTDETQKGNKA
jgi:hypothetical protein